MAVSLNVQLFDAFLGTQEGIHSVLLPDVFSSGGSQNLYIDKLGRAKKISGYAKANATPVTTDTGASATLARGLTQYRSTGGGSVTRQLLGVFDDSTNEWEIWKSTDTGATWSFVSDLGASAVGQTPDFAQFGDTLYITSGKVAPKKWDGTTLSAAGYTQSPTVTSAVGAAGNLSGTYQWKLLSLVGTTRQKGSIASTARAFSATQGSLSWTADANTSVTGYELYRTTGTGKVYYFVAYIDGRTTVTYTDNIADSTILSNRVMEEHGDTPPTTYFCENHKQRMWWLRTDANPTRAYWSDPGAAESVYSENFLDFSDGETIGDFITGCVGNYENMLVVFTERAVWPVSGTGQIVGYVIDWNKTRSNAVVGCASSKSIARIPPGSKFVDQDGIARTAERPTIAYFTPFGDIRLFDGDSDTIISHPMRETLATINYTYRARVHCVTDTPNSQVIWFIPTGTASEPNVGIVWNYKWGVWYKWTPQPFSCAVEIETASDASTILAGANSPVTGGYVYTLFSGDSFDGSNIDARWMTKTLRGIAEGSAKPALSHTKRWRWADFLIAVDAASDLTLEWLESSAGDDSAGFASTTIPAPSDALYTDGGADLILTASSDSITASRANFQSKVLLHDQGGDYLHDEGIRLRISDNAQAGSWAIEAFSLAYQILPGLGRRNQ